MHRKAVTLAESPPTSFARADLAVGARQVKELSVRGGAGDG